MWTFDLRFDTYILWPAANPDAQLELIAIQVVPAVRAQIRRESSEAIGRP